MVTRSVLMLRALHAVEVLPDVSSHETALPAVRSVAAEFRVEADALALLWAQKALGCASAKVAVQAMESAGAEDQATA